MDTQELQKWDKILLLQKDRVQPKKQEWKKMKK